MKFSSRKEWLRMLATVLVAGVFSNGYMRADEPAKPQASGEAVEKKEASPQGAVTDVPVKVNAAVTAESVLYDLSQSLFVAGSGGGGPTRPEENLSEYWIGITGNTVDDVLRSHLEIPADRGLIITQLLEESPAAKAGLKVNDVLLAAGDKPIKEVGDLGGIIGDKKDSLLAIRLIRTGKPIIVEVKPERRPATQTGETCPAISKAKDEEFVSRVFLDLIGTAPEPGNVKLFVEDSQKDKRTQLVSKLLRRSTVAKRSCLACHSADAEDVKLYGSLVLNTPHVWTNKLGRGNFTIVADDLTPHYRVNLLSQPGAVVLSDGGLSGAVQIPDDMTISITRKGKEPAAIKVTQGENSWGATEKDYTQTLPAEIRGHVETILKGQVLAIDVGQDKTQLKVWLSGEADVRAAETQPAGDDAVTRVKKQLEALAAQLAELQKTVGELKKPAGK